MSNLIDQSSGLTLGITSLLVIYSAFILIIAIWGSSLLKTTCTNLTLRFNLRALVITGAIMCTGFASYGMCKLTCNEYVENGPVGTFLSGREGEIPTWLIGMLFVLSIMNIVFLSNTMSEFNKDASCKTEKLDTYKQVVIYALVFTVLILILTLFILGYRAKQSKLGKRAARAAALSKRKKELSQINPEQQAREASLLEEERKRASLIEADKAAAAKANREAGLLETEKTVKEQRIQAERRLAERKAEITGKKAKEEADLKAREDLVRAANLRPPPIPPQRKAEPESDLESKIESKMDAEEDGSDDEDFFLAKKKSVNKSPIKPINKPIINPFANLPPAPKSTPIENTPAQRQNKRSKPPGTYTKELNRRLDNVSSESEEEKTMTNTQAQRRFAALKTASPSSEKKAQEQLGILLENLKSHRKKLEKQELNKAE